MANDLEWEVRHTKSTLYKGRGNTPEEARKIAIAAYPISESKSGDIGYGWHITYWGPQWRRFHRILKKRGR